MSNQDWRSKRATQLYQQLKEMDEAVQDAIIDKLKTDGLKSAMRDLSKTKTVYFGDLYADAIDRQKTFNSFEGLRTGLRYFDDATMGLRGGETIVIAGPSNLGKTMVALNVVANIVQKSEAKVLIVSMEMPALDIASRLYNMADDHAPLMGNVIIQTELQVNTKHIAAMIERHKPDVVMLDHIQFLANQEKASNEFEKINVAVKKLQGIAIEYDVPILVISHVAKTRSGKENRASAADLKGSSSIEQDTDIVFMLNRTADQRRTHDLEIELVKHRKKGSKLYYKPCIMKFNGVRLHDFGAYTYADQLEPDLPSLPAFNRPAALPAARKDFQ